jgi:membrane-associated phospholipid phosphatase
MTLPVKNNSGTWFSPVNRITAIFFISGLLVFFFMLWLVFYYRNSTFDSTIFAAISPHISGAGTRFMKSVSFLGSHKFLIPANFILIALFMLKKNKRAAIRAGVVALSSLGLMSLLKRLFQRHRPADPLVDGITNFSFPSGHAFMSVAFYGLLCCWVWFSVHNKRQKNMAIAILFLLILIIGFSRIYLRVHYATDVLAGFAAGTAWLLFSFYLSGYLLNKGKHGGKNIIDYT